MAPGMARRRESAHRRPGEQPAPWRPPGCPLSVGQQLVPQDGRNHSAGNQPFVVDAVNDFVVLLPAVLPAVVVAVVIAALESLAEIMVVLVLGDIAAVVSVVGVPIGER